LGLGLGLGLGFCLAELHNDLGMDCGFLAW
jgi:hypothetical protein